MSDASIGASGSAGHGWLDRERTIAGPGFNRWLVPPAALAIHLCIGMVYGFSVFWLPLSRALQGTSATTCANLGILDALTTTSCNWPVTDLVITFTLAIAVLGVAAALWGGWLEREGPRKAGFVAACCWGGGFLVSALGIYLHQLWLLWLGSGLIGGIGLGLGYISPVSTLIKWFPDRRGMATGMAIMGFGGGALIGAPLANLLINHFKLAGTSGVWQTFVTLGILYFIFMMGGAFGYRLPPSSRWIPEGWQPPATKAAAMITPHVVRLNDAHKTPQFWLIWVVLCMNVSAGIGVLAMASPMLQEIFGGALIGHPGLHRADLDATQLKTVATIGAGFIGLLSLFNIVGRFFWASLSDRIGRKATYSTFFALGIALYALSPWAARSGNQVLFVLFFGVILSMYGGGFATVPAYLADMFGSEFVGAIHGRLLTAWSMAGVIGPILVSHLRDAQTRAGIAADRVYDYTLYILAGLLLIGLICNLLIRPVAAKWYMSEPALAEYQARVKHVAERSVAGSFGIGRGGFDGRALLAWLIVGLPILWGVWVTLPTVMALIR
ncbi:MAG: OFA family MFS transporter [Steroidobacteraceae bacterium]|jgi:MFS family permease